MNTQINLTYKGVNYTLEYNRMAIKYIESQGFILDEFSTQPMSMIELAFKGAFYKNHRKTPMVLIEEIYNNCEKKQDLISNINQMITECYNSLLDSPKEGAEGNATWSVVSLSPIDQK